MPAIAAARPPLESTFNREEVMSLIWKFLAKIPPAKVEVPVPSDLIIPSERVRPFEEDSPPVEIPPAKVEVAVDVAVNVPTVKFPTVDEDVIEPP